MVQWNGKMEEDMMVTIKMIRCKVSELTNMPMVRSTLANGKTTKRMEPDNFCFKVANYCEEYGMRTDSLRDSLAGRKSVTRLLLHQENR
jgi:hypothetical protein